MWRRNSMWINLTTDVTADILQRLGAVDMLSNARFVCATWATVCRDPAMWRAIDLRTPREPGEYLKKRGTDGMCRLAVDLSQGQSISIHVEDLVEAEPLLNKTLMHISIRLPNLTRLSLANCSAINGLALARAVERLERLEELHLSAVENIHPRRIKTIGDSRQTLISFTFNLRCQTPPVSPDNPEEDIDYLEEFEESGLYEYLEDEGEEDEEEGGGSKVGGGQEEGGGPGEEGGGPGFEVEYFEDDSMDERKLGSKYAFAIAESMPNLRHLALRANFMRNDGIQRLLDGCPQLESLDIRECSRVDLSRFSGTPSEIRLQQIRIKGPIAEVEG